MIGLQHAFADTYTRQRMVEKVETPEEASVGTGYGPYDDAASVN